MYTNIKDPTILVFVVALKSHWFTFKNGTFVVPGLSMMLNNIVEEQICM